MSRYYTAADLEPYKGKPIYLWFDGRKDGRDYEIYKFFPDSGIISFIPWNKSTVNTLIHIPIWEFIPGLVQTRDYRLKYKLAKRPFHTLRYTPFKPNRATEPAEGWYNYLSK